MQGMCQITLILVKHFNHNDDPSTGFSETHNESREPKRIGGASPFAFESPFAPHNQEALIRPQILLITPVHFIFRVNPHSWSCAGNIHGEPQSTV